MLPECLMCDILSLLDTKDAVATTLASMKWRHLFPLLPKLNLNLDDSSMNKAHFVEFVDGVLNMFLQNARNVCSLRFSGDDKVYARIESWINAAVGLKLESLDLKFRRRKEFWFENAVSCFVQLRNLKLTNVVFLRGSLISLLNLGILCLERVWLPDEEMVTDVLKGCPVLEELIVVECVVCEYVFRVCAPNLKCLKMVNVKCEDPEFGDLVVDCRIEIDTPALEKLHYTDNDLANAEYTITEMPFLENVVLDVYNENEYDDCDEVAEFILSCSRTKFLTLSERTLRSDFLLSLSTSFPNLERLGLEIDISDPDTLKVLILMLNYAPNLSSLGIEMMRKEKCDEEFFFHEDEVWRSMEEDVPDCLTLSLRSISITAFTGADDEFVVLDYLIQHAKRFEKLDVEIDTKLKREDQLSVKEKLLRSPHWSKKCRVVLKRSA